MNESKKNKKQPRTLDNRRKTVYTLGGAYLIYTAVRLWEYRDAAAAGAANIAPLAGALVFMLAGVGLITFAAVKSVQEYKRAMEESKKEKPDDE